MTRYIWNVLISIDQLGNTLLGGNPDQTISGRIGRHILTRPRSFFARIWLPQWLRNHFINSVGS